MHYRLLMATALSVVACALAAGPAAAPGWAPGTEKFRGPLLPV